MYAILFTPCFSCESVIGCNPIHVPSIVWKGSRRPICKDCVEMVNPFRIENGLEPIQIHPEAYEPVPEGQL